MPSFSLDYLFHNAGYRKIEMREMEGELGWK